MFYPIRIRGAELCGKTRTNRTVCRSSRQPVTRLKLETLEERITPTTSAFPLAGAGVNSTDLSQGTAVATDSSGNVYITGTWEGTQNFGGTSLTSHGADDAYVAKYSSTGVLQWVADFGGGGSTVTTAGIAVDSAGNVYTTGYFQGTTYFNGFAGTDSLTSSNGGSDENVYVSKLTTNGGFDYVEDLGAGTYAQAAGIAVNASTQAVYVTGSFVGTGNFNPGSGTNDLTSSNSGSDTNSFVVGLAADGSYAFADLLGSGSTAVAKAIAVDSSGDVYSTGWFTGTGNFDPAGTDDLTSTGGINSYVSKLSSTGAFDFGEVIGAGSVGAFATAIAVDGSGNVYTTGSFAGTGNFSGGSAIEDLTSSSSGSDINAFVLKMSSSGQYDFADILGSGSSDAEGNGIALDHSGNIYVAGTFVGTGNFNPGSGTANLTSSSGGTDTNTFVSKLNSSGQYVSANNLGSGSSDAVGNGIAVDGSGNVYTVGTYAGTGSFSGGGTNQNLTSSYSGANNSFFLDQVAVQAVVPPPPPATGAVLVADFKGNGLYEYTSASGWTKIKSSDPTSFQADAAGDVVAVFSTGIFEYSASTSTWTRLSASIPADFVLSSAGEVVADFQGNGLFEYSAGSGWTRLSNSVPTSFRVDGAGDVYAGFQGNGLFEYVTGSGWTRLSNTDPSSFRVDAAGDVFAYFQGNGLYVHAVGESWVRLSTNDPISFAVDSTGDLFADFAGEGLYEISPGGSWVRINTTVPTSFAVNSAGEVVASFSGTGLSEYTAGSGWTSLNPNQPAAYGVDAEGDVFAAFSGNGVWMLASGGSWTKLTAGNTTSLAIAG